MAVNRRAQWLAATLIAAIIGLMVVRSMGDGGTPVSRGRPAPRGTPAAVPSESPIDAAPAYVNLTGLEHDRGQPGNQGRNPFRFRPQRPSPAAGLSPGAPEQTTGPVTPVGPVGPAGPSPLPPIPLKFIGLVEKADGTKIAVLSDGHRPYHGMEGHEIEGRYRILKIGLESIEIAYLDGRGRQTIRLTGQ